MSHRPRIAIPLRRNLDAPNEYLSPDYAAAVHAAGGAPFYVPLIPDPSSVRRLVETADGVCLSGSNSDVDPALYGAERHPKLGPVQPLRDATDALLLEEVERRGLPLLAICYGVQRLNVFRGGDLHQDLASAGYDHIDHRVFPGAGHDVSLDLDDWPRPLWKLRESIRALAPPGSGGACVFRVNTSHHQAVHTPAPGSVVFARAPDGVVEGIVLPGTDHFLLGVQWHPERDPESGLSQVIFRGFVEACAAYRPL